MRPALKRRELLQDAGLVPEQAGEVHHLREPEHRGWLRQGEQVRGVQACAGRLEVGGGHAARKLHPQVHGKVARTVEEALQAGNAQHVADLMRIADRGGGAARQHAAIELGRRDQRALDVDVGVDEARDGDQPSAVDLARALRTPL